MQNSKSLYQTEFIVKTLSEHYSVIDSSKKVTGVHDLKDRPCGALALSAAAVGDIIFPLAALSSQI
jgi:hypothetical protein